MAHFSVISLLMLSSLLMHVYGFFVATAAAADVVVAVIMPSIHVLLPLPFSYIACTSLHLFDDNFSGFVNRQLVEPI